MSRLKPQYRLLSTVSAKIQARGRQLKTFFGTCSTRFKFKKDGTAVETSAHAHEGQPNVFVVLYSND